MTERTLVATGTVTVRHVETGREWQEAVEVFAEDIEEDWGVEDAAAEVVHSQAGPWVEPVEFDLS